MDESEPTCPGCRKRDKIIRSHEERIAALERTVEELKRAMHRPAAPFSRGYLKPDPKPPGRKPGHEGEHRAVPTNVDRVLDAPLPDACPGCGGAVAEDTVHAQYQTDIPPVVPVTTRFDIHVGHCLGCGKRLQGRHAEQTSNALGAAAVQLGPRVVAMGLEMHVRLGLSFRRLAETLVRFFGLQAAPGTFARAMRRLARSMRPSCEGIRNALRASPSVHGDGTGWRVGGKGACLHTVCTKSEALYLVDKRWGAEPTVEVLGEDYAGVFVSDGLPAFKSLKWRRQRCTVHLIRYAREIEQEKIRGAVRYPRAVKALLRDAMALGRRRDDMAPERFARSRLRLDERLWELLMANLTDLDNAKLRGRLWGAEPHLFTFLDVPGVEPSNNQAESTLRPAVIARKLSAGNRTWPGAEAWATLASIIETSRRRGEDFTQLVLHAMQGSTIHAQPAIALVTR